MCTPYIVVLELEAVTEAGAAGVIFRGVCMRLATLVLEEKPPGCPDLVCEIGKVYRVPERTTNGRLLLALGHVLFVRICPLHENGKEDHLRSFRRENLLSCGASTNLDAGNERIQTVGNVGRCPEF